ncbi:GntR family transcriptional regulator [Saccharothrix longispora]|uniref:GntR family transcriptional regulator n=1 Tax=Saccharothrix longispora TaxID=33920 RepID=UPI0028FD98C9|nr:GntR family transcriptional regulator [Saccharothrix longispora]MBY8848985.1 GntR family transcriptional regulator [Saccharothrix sp. MB29]MDU0289754.1 GntR family transcriptional regulator [Saccharothrix longispora]
MSNPLPRAARRGLAEESADRIRDAIFAGHFPPGAPLREVELAASLEVSRGSVREGLALLEREGLVRSAWHRGTTVVEVTAEDVEEVYTVRAALDRLAATTALRRATADELAALDRLVDAMADELADGGDGPRLLALDIAFHDAVYAAAGNRRLTRAWHAVRSQVRLFQLRRIALGHAHYRARVVAEHRELVALLRAGDAEALARVAEEHVDSARRGLLAHLSRVDG